MANVRTKDPNTTLPAYLDCAATTPIDERVAREIEQYLLEDFGNAGSRTHEYGARAKQRVGRAREEVGALVGAGSDEVVFTSGATESNNLAILGLADALREEQRTHLVATRLEHKSVLEPLRVLEERGFSITWVDVDDSGVVDPAAVSQAITPETGLLTLMHVNNETGAIQPIAEIALLLERHPAFFHVDAAQSFGKLNDVLNNPRIDMISASGHKLHGPKGVGALVTRRRGFSRIPLRPLMFGGGQEHGVRPGTTPVHLVAGFGCAASIALTSADEWLRAAAEFRDIALDGLSSLAPVVNGDPSRSIPTIINVSFPGYSSEAVLVRTKDIVSFSNGSACTSNSYEPSHVLTAMGLSEERIGSAIRLSWSHLTPQPNWSAFVSEVKSLPIVAA